MNKANTETKTYEDFFKDAERKAEKLQNEFNQYQGTVAKIEEYQQQMAANSDLLTELNPEAEKLKQ